MIAVASEYSLYTLLFADDQVIIAAATEAYEKWGSIIYLANIWIFKGKGRRGGRPTDWEQTM